MAGAAAVVVVVVGARMASADRGEEPMSATSFLAATGGWRRADFDRRDGSSLFVRLEDYPDPLSIDLTRSAVFDCRTDCLQDVRESLVTVGPSERLCVYTNGAWGGPTKLWINRDMCPEPE